MQFKADDTGKRGVLTFEGAVTIQRAEEIKSFLLSALETAGEVMLDVSNVTEVDLCGLQLLCSAQRTASKWGKGLTPTGNIPAIFRKTAEEAGRCFHSGCGATDHTQCLWKGVQG